MIEQYKKISQLPWIPKRNIISSLKFHCNRIIIRWSSINLLFRRYCQGCINSSSERQFFITWLINYDLKRRINGTTFLRSLNLSNKFVIFRWFIKMLCIYIWKLVYSSLRSSWIFFKHDRYYFRIIRFIRAMKIPMLRTIILWKKQYIYSSYKENTFWLRGSLFNQMFFYNFRFQLVW